MKRKQVNCEWALYWLAVDHIHVLVPLPDLLNNPPFI